MIETYIRLKRKSINWGWYTAPHHFHLFTHLLLSANWNEGEFMGHKLKRGQFATSLASLEIQTGISRQTIRTCLSHFQSTGEIAQKVTNKYRILTIVNFEKYQIDEEQLTSKQQTTNKQLTTIKEGNKEIKKKTKAKKENGFEEFWDAVKKKTGKREAERKYNKALAEGVEHDILVSAVRNYYDSVKDMNFAKHPATWLHQGCWMDEEEAKDAPVNLGEEEKAKRIAWYEKMGMDVPAELMT